jgi:hypothetical protein
MPVSELLIDVAPAYSPPNGFGSPIACEGASIRVARMSNVSSLSQSYKTFATEAAAFSVPSIYERINLAQTLIHEDLKSEPVVQQVFSSLATSAQQSNAQIFRLVGAENLVANSMLAPASLPPPRDLTELEFLSFGNALRKGLLNSASLYANTTALRDPTFAQFTANSANAKLFRDTLAKYFSAYYQGGYVDRFGDTIPKPILAQNVGNTELAGVASVFLDFMMDYSLRTPVWKDKNGNFWPGNSKTPPTATTIPNFIITLSLLDDGDSQKCGITPLKAEAIEYIAKAAGNRASMLAGTFGSSIGGIHIGIGVLGKLSIGDNQTLQVLTKTSLSKTFERAGEESAYRILTYIGYPKDLTTLADLLQKYLDWQRSSANISS